jgi:hypothetical protein
LLDATDVRFEDEQAIEEAFSSGRTQLPISLIV